MVLLLPVSPAFPVSVELLSFTCALLGSVGVIVGFHELSHIAYFRFYNMEDRISGFHFDKRLRSIGIIAEGAPPGSYLASLYSIPIPIVINWILGIPILLIIFDIFLAIFGWVRYDFKEYKIKKKQISSLN